MIQIDIEMPKCCDVCMFSQWSNLSQTASCKLKDYEPCFADFSKEYRSKRASFCPLQEVSNNSPELDKENGELINRQAVLDAIFSEPLYESGMKKRDAGIVVPAIYEKIKALPPSPSRPPWIPCSERLPEQPNPNPELEGKPLDIYLVCKQDNIPFRAFWNGRNFADGWTSLDVDAWMPLPEPWKDGEAE